MTELLERAFAEASSLPEGEQDMLARWLLDEIASDRRWEDAFANSHSHLAQLATEALAEHDAGHTLELDPDRP